MENKMLLRIVIPKFARSIQVSRARRANFYHEGEKIPKKYLGEYYAFALHKKKLVLHNIQTKQPIVKNPNTAGTPKHEQIAGNIVWNTNSIGNYVEIMKLSLEEYFWTVIKHFKLELTDIREIQPLRVHLEFYVYKEKQDTDNLDLFYRKAFVDSLQDRTEFSFNGIEKRLIKNDKVFKSFYTDVHDVTIEDEEKLVITISNCNNTIINYDEIVLKINTNELRSNNK